MGDVSIIARRLEGGKRVQYGWSGNGGYFSNVGRRLLWWYDDLETVEYLFGLGQMRIIGSPGSENGGEHWYYTNTCDGTPHWSGKSEREIFSQIMFVDYGYFYDLDNKWYYIVPGPFRIKIPLKYIAEHLDSNGDEFRERDRIDEALVKYIFDNYYQKDAGFKKLINDEYPEGVDAIKGVVFSDQKDNPSYSLYKNTGSFMII